MDVVQEVEEGDLPQSFINKIVKNDGNSIEIRSSVKNLSDTDSWINEFSKNTNTNWIVRSSRPNETTKTMCRYVC